MGGEAVTTGHVAFIGLGNMGSGMAANLAKAGFGVRAFDLNPEATKRLSGSGVETAPSASAAARGAATVITMLPSARIVQEVYECEVLPVADQPTTLIDCSTIDVVTTRHLTKIADERGHSMVDAPVSGGVSAAAGGTLTFMVGGSKEAFAKVRPLLLFMGKSVIHAGGPGNGQAAKICNNMLLGISMLGTCEAFVLAQKLGLDPQVFFDISSKASGQCWSMTSYCPVPGPVPSAPSNREYEGGFAAALMLKDLRLATEAARHAATWLPFGSLAENAYETFIGLGGAEKDFSAIIKMLDRDPPQ